MSEESRTIQMYTIEWYVHRAREIGEVCWAPKDGRATYEVYPGGRVVDWSDFPERLPGLLALWLNRGGRRLREQFSQIAVANTDAGNLISKSCKAELAALGLVTPSYGSIFRLTPFGVSVCNIFLTESSPE